MLLFSERPLQLKVESIYSYWLLHWWNIILYISMRLLFRFYFISVYLQTFLFCLTSHFAAGY
uniref:Uncharacterized protein n=1 Tax=Arundo donax TaxID=35708 RepID=A0A0A9A204_ARUDO